MLRVSGSRRINASVMGVLINTPCYTTITAISNRQRQQVSSLFPIGHIYYEDYLSAREIQ